SRVRFRTSTLCAPVSLSMTTAAKFSVMSVPFLRQAKGRGCNWRGTASPWLRYRIEATPENFMAFSLTSPVFEDGGAIPKKYTRDGQNVSPPLKWKDPPKDAKSFVLVVEDPDAPRGTFRHWAVYDIPTVVTELWENATK